MTRDIVVNGDVVVTLGMARMLRRLWQANSPLSRHCLYHGSTGCSAAELQTCLEAALVSLTTPEAPKLGEPGRPPAPLVQLTELGTNVLAVFRFPTSGKPRRPPPGSEGTEEQFLADLLGRVRGGETVVVD